MENYLILKPKNNKFIKMMIHTILRLISNKNNLSTIYVLYAFIKMSYQTDIIIVSSIFPTSNFFFKNYRKKK